MCISDKFKRYVLYGVGFSRSGVGVEGRHPLLHPPPHSHSPPLSSFSFREDAFCLVEARLSLNHCDPFDEELPPTQQSKNENLIFENYLPFHVFNNCFRNSFNGFLFALQLQLNDLLCQN